ncbi:cupin domain-containing protein [Flavobacterium sp. KJJ]|uniref:cupin domain-containing protein n=1 Tax=Flavobacterium sp. KJJ TaxID=1270193 RepID=UPI000493991B|nr:cupin domain-containing protein [Flavobacterium sp. KJJ]
MKKGIIAIAFIMSFLSANAQYNNKLIIEKLMQSDSNSMGQKISYPDVKDAKITMMKITFPPGETTGWHKHNIPVFSYILKGTLTVQTEDNKIIEYKENTSFAESYNIYHKGTNNGKTDLVVLAIYLGGDKEELSVKKE